jgi:hypothetical protein
LIHIIAISHVTSLQHSHHRYILYPFMQTFSNIEAFNTPSATYTAGREVEITKIDGSTMKIMMPGAYEVATDTTKSHSRMKSVVNKGFSKAKRLPCPAVGAPSPPAAAAVVDSRVVGESQPINDIIWDKYQQDPAWTRLSSAERAAIKEGLGKFHPAPIEWFVVSHCECV